MLFYIKAKVSIRVAGISGPFERSHSALVNANNVTEAKQKFEVVVKRENSNMQAQSFNFEYVEIAGEIK
jgi:hypothetical protein